MKKYSFNNGVAGVMGEIARSDGGKSEQVNRTS